MFVAVALTACRSSVGDFEMTSFLKFHAFATTRGDGLRPELRALFERTAAAPRSELTVRDDGMIQSGPNPVSALSQCLHTPSRTSITRGYPQDIQERVVTNWKNYGSQGG
jgi:hypothetical protein